MDGVYTHCRSRGADGFAFVVHNMGSTELGNSGMGLGYDAINNSLAVEFDTFFNAENGDQYENAVSVHTRGSRYPNSAEEVRLLHNLRGVGTKAQVRHCVNMCCVLWAGVLFGRFHWRLQFG